MANNRLEKKIADQVVKPYLDAQVSPGYGIILDYNKTKNTAIVLMSQQGSDMPGEMYHNVPCPSQLGLQTVNPEKGRQCWVTFKNGDGEFPIVTHFYNYFYEDYDDAKQQNAIAPLPSFIHNL
jgi:hypothetical protein